MGITSEQKNDLREALRAYIEQKGSIDKAANSLRNISASTLRNILKDDFPHISNEVWRSLRAQVCESAGPGEEWVVVETPVFNDIYSVMNDAQEYQEVHWLIGGAGCGKTTAAREYCKSHKNVFYVLCDEDMHKRDFVLEMGRAMGMRVNTQRRIRDGLLEIITELVETEKPLIILDEADKLPDSVIHYFITLYNRLEDKAGIVLLSTSYMQERIKSGLARNRPGYQEVNSRLGQKFYMAEKNTANEVYAICRANGITDDRQLAAIIKDVERCEFDIRRAKKKVKAVRKQQSVA